MPVVNISRCACSVHLGGHGVNHIHTASSYNPHIRWVLVWRAECVLVEIFYHHMRTSVACSVAPEHILLTYMESITFLKCTFGLVRNYSFMGSK